MEITLGHTYRWHATTEIKKRVQDSLWKADLIKISTLTLYRRYKCKFTMKKTYMTTLQPL